MSDNIKNENIRSLNMKQREVFNFTHKWSRDYIKKQRSKVIKKLNDFIYLSLAVLRLENLLS